ncbi:hypothetical protein F4775DRAFT_595309 [Biscogniauxia sp. FL1348]|nr:hypothetical protein F4775DRAFT_595309 [Biscogniauxia sp. FL1348]
MLSPSSEEEAPSPTEGHEHMSTSVDDTMDYEIPESSPKKDETWSVVSKISKVDSSNSDEATADQMVYEATIYEIDEDNIIRGLHTDKPGELRIGAKKIPAILPKEPGFDPETIWDKVAERSPNEVAISVDKFKRPLLLHDLVDEDNTGVMVIQGDHVIIQGHHEEVRSTMGVMLETHGGNTQPSLLVSVREVYGESAARERQANRRYSLVDFKRRYKVMDRKHAERLMDKEWTEPDFKGLVVLEMRPADPSPIGALKEGRRLVSIESEEDSTGLRQAQFGRPKGDTESTGETEATSYRQVLASKTWFG